MLFKEIFGKAIKNIYVKYGMEQGWLDVAECFIVLDNGSLIGIPFGPTEPDSEMPVKILDPEATSIFADPASIPANHKDLRQRLKTTIRKIFGTKSNDTSEHLLGRKIVDFIWYEGSDQSGFLLLDNGGLITEILMAPHGTGHAGLHYYKSLTHLAERHGNNYRKVFG